MTVTIIFLVAILVLLLWHISLIISVISGAPTVYAKDNYILTAYDLVKPEPGQTILDLGCGNAKSLIIAAKKYKTKGIGIEISPFYYMLARVNVLFSRQSPNIRIYYGNALSKGDLIQKADIIYLYLFQKLLSKIEPIIYKNLKPNAKIVSIAFPLAGKKPLLKNDKPPIFVYK